jgi:hypothetical protein
MTSIKINIPEGFEVDYFDTSTCELKFKSKPVKITDRIKTVLDVLDFHGITQSQFNASCAGLSEDEINYRILKLLVLALNEGWVPDWKNHNQYKYFPWFEMAGSSGFRFVGCDHWLRFRLSALAFALNLVNWQSTLANTSRKFTKSS